MIRIIKKTHSPAPSRRDGAVLKDAIALSLMVISRIRGSVALSVSPFACLILKTFPRREMSMRVEALVASMVLWLAVVLVK
jgi:hypothetical protein